MKTELYLLAWAYLFVCFGFMSKRLETDSFTNKIKGFFFTVLIGFFLFPVLIGRLLDKQN